MIVRYLRKRAYRSSIVISKLTRADDGIALALVMFPLLIAALIAACLTSTTRADLLTTQNAQDGFRRQLAEETVINHVLLQLMGRGDQWPPLDGREKIASFDGLTIDVSVRAESAKINLNQIPNPAVVNLMAMACVPRPTADALADEIADYVDEDDTAHLHGLEKSGYAALGLPYGPRNGRFQSIDEVRRIPGMTEDLFEWIRPFVTVYSFNKIPDLGLADPIIRRAVIGLAPANTGVGENAIAVPPRANSAASIGFVGIITITAWSIENQIAMPALEETVYLTGDATKPLLMLNRRVATAAPGKQRKVCS